MKHILILVLVIVFVGCKGQNNDKNIESTYEIKIIDRCQYVYVSRRPYDVGFSITHKGNCNNIEHATPKK